jgi:hypothetical protein
MTAGTCKSYSFAAKEFISKFTFYFNSAKVLGLGFTTSSGGKFDAGLQASNLANATSFSFNETFNLMGLFGSASASGINSLGGIRLKTDCTFFELVSVVNNESLNQTISTANFTNTNSSVVESTSQT